VPGYEGRDQSDERFVRAADEIGYPVMIKAAAGGGGRGMRLCNARDEMVAALSLARSEAENAFGSGELILEKAIVRPRHVEIQVFGDRHGNVIHLGERDCSVQRRHQKVIEEAPCPVMTESLREQMGRAAVEAARSIGYVGAGTVEFLLDEGGQFYFLEMNTRLQVEHPVTELITGLDLVALQIKVAEGHPLGIAQGDVRLSGHAIEARLYAEDPAQNFLPSTGLVERWQPAAGEGVRVDDGIRTGQEISPFYDAMVAKIIGFGPTRDIARRRLIAALDGSVLFGPKTNRRFLLDCLENESFAQRGATTAFIEQELDKGAREDKAPTAAQAAAIAVVRYVLDRDDAYARSVGCAEPLQNWSTAGTMYTHYRLAVGDARFDLRVSPLSRDSYRVLQGKEETSVELLAHDGRAATLRIGDRKLHVVFQLSGEGTLWASFEGRTFLFRDLFALVAREESAEGSGRVVAPMHGVVREVSAAIGDAVTPGTRLAILEAMKMQLEIKATVAGVVREVRATPGQQAAAGAVLFEIEPNAD
jgi:geranyl-CoA carboxylase alpha subunit